MTEPNSSLPENDAITETDGPELNEDSSGSASTTIINIPESNTEVSESLAEEDSSDCNDVSPKSKKKFVSEVTCKMCFDPSLEEEPITPCFCKGSIGKVHLSCLERWLGTNNSFSCELCGYQFTTVRRPMYSIYYGIYFWLFKEDHIYRRGASMDLFILIALTPFVCVGVYSSIAITSYYQHHEDQKAVAAGNWTSLLLSMMAFVIAMGYYLWASFTIKNHGRNWYNWWQSKNVVRVISKATPDQPNLSNIVVETAFV